MSAIITNYMSRSYTDYSKKYDTENATSKNMASAIAEISESNKVGSVSTQDMTMEEYKAYIEEKISKLPIHPSRMQESISINISEAGFEAMKNDPKYEEWVMKHLQEEFMCYDPWVSTCGGAYSVLYIGVSKDECYGVGWYPGYNNGNGKELYNEKSQNSFWERRAENKKQLEIQMEKRQEQKRIQQQKDEKAAYERFLQHKRLMNQIVKEDITKTERTRVTASMENATASYEANFSIVNGEIVQN